MVEKANLSGFAYLFVVVPLQGRSAVEIVPRLLANLFGQSMTVTKFLDYLARFQVLMPKLLWILSLVSKK